MNKIVYHVLLVPGYQLAPPIVIGQRRPGSLQTDAEHTLQEDQ